MFRNYRKGIIVEFLWFAIFVLVSVAGVFLFVTFFKYNVTAYITSDSQKIKTYLIPLVVVIEDYGDDSFGTIFSKIDNNIVSMDVKSKIRSEIDDLIKKYFITRFVNEGPEYGLCYELNVLQRKGWFEDLGNAGIFTYGDKICDVKPFSRAVFPIPVIYDGVDFIKEIEFKTFKIVKRG